MGVIAAPAHRGAEERGHRGTEAPGRQSSSYALVPWPARLEPRAGSFTIAPATRIALVGWTQAAAARLGAQAAAVVRESGGMAPRTARYRQAPRSGVIALIRDTTVVGDEAYRLDADTSRVLITARAEAGAFYGLQTLRQLIPVPTVPSGPSVPSVPSVFIADSPRFQWRGMHLDVGRHLFPVEFIRRYLDLMARYKLNTFHWHLSDDQGWRLEIRRYPRLTEVGAWRRETMVGRHFDPYVGDGRRYGGFYTQREVREIVAYAAARHITVVPEIEMPGHSLALLAAYPELACTPGPFEVATRWGVFDDVLCPTERTFTFLQGVLEEVLDLFPSRFIHVGGDEVPKRRWRESAEAQEAMRREGLRNEDELQSWFVRRIERWLSGRGRRLVGWDEILEGGLPQRATVMSWRGTAGGLAAAREGRDVVMSPTSNLYFDYYQGDPRFEPLAIGGFLPLERVYSFEPVPDSLPPERHHHILGAQGNVWTEYIPTGAQVEYMALPRMLALAEVVWSPREARNWDDFFTRLRPRLRELDRMGVNYRIPHVSGLDEDRLTLAETATVTLGTALADAVIRYTTDGSDPDTASPLYSAPFVVRPDTAGVVVTARAFLHNGRASALRAARFTRGVLRPPDLRDTAGLSRGLVARHHTGRFSRVADLDTARVDSTGTVAGVAPLLGSPAENYGLVLTGYMAVPADGVYAFRLTSDDGSTVTLGERVVVDNDGLHGPEPRIGRIALGAGLHRITVRFFQRGGGHALRLEYAPEGRPFITTTGKLFR